MNIGDRVQQTVESHIYTGYIVAVQETRSRVRWHKGYASWERNETLSKVEETNA